MAGDGFDSVAKAWGLKARSVKFKKALASVRERYAGVAGILASRPHLALAFSHQAKRTAEFDPSWLLSGSATSAAVAGAERDADRAALFATGDIALMALARVDDSKYLVLIDPVLIPWMQHQCSGTTPRTAVPRFLHKFTNVREAPQGRDAVTGKFKWVLAVLYTAARVCHACGASGPRRNACTCGTARYCNKECQTLHWNMHRPCHAISIRKNEGLVSVDRQALTKEITDFLAGGYPVPSGHALREFNTDTQNGDTLLSGAF